MYMPTVLQNAIGAPLRSEQHADKLLPRVLSRLDMLTIFIIIVVFIPNASVVHSTRGLGIANYLLWLLGIMTFLLPGALVSAQLNRFMPVEGSIYVWTHRALGPIWGFLGGGCAWFAGMLEMLACSNSVIATIQGTSILLWGKEPGWLVTSWQQGIAVVAILLLTGWFVTFPLSSIMKWAKGIIALYAGAILLIGLAGVVWQLQKHVAQVPLTMNAADFVGQSFLLYGAIVLALLGIEVPLNMAAETRQPNAPKLFLSIGPFIVLIAYLLTAFGVMSVLPNNAPNTLYLTITVADMVFGAPGALLVGFSIITFCIISMIIYNLIFARILFVAALDYRLPTPLARINHHRVPSRATTIQTFIVLIIVLLVYIIGPFLYHQEGAVFSLMMCAIIQSVATIIWFFSMVFLFLDLPVLLKRFHRLLIRNTSQLIAPPWLLYLCSFVGGLASLIGIWTILKVSWNSQLISDEHWRLTVSITTIIFLAIGLISAAYPRLLSNVKMQQVAYQKLSELDQLKDAFLATASHELRTPLTIVQGYLELLKLMEDASGDEKRAFIAKACRACDELVVLLANVMDASRLKLDAAALHLENVALKSTTLAIVDLFEPLVLQQQRVITLDIDENITVKADETRLKQVLHNLISNALRYSPAKTPIQIVATVEKGEMVRISVSDQGLGIPPDKQATIFDKFVRLERDMHGEVRGSGLGLFITRQLVEAMQGTIRVESSGIEHEGSTFSFTLRSAQ